MQHDERFFMMNYPNGWTIGWMGGGMWIWVIIGTFVAVLLVNVIDKQSKK